MLYNVIYWQLIVLMQKLKLQFKIGWNITTLIHTDECRRRMRVK